MDIVRGLAASLVLIPASPAAAGTLTTTNARLWSFDGLWRDEAVDLTGTGAPTPVAPASGVSLTAASVHARLPDWVGSTGANTGTPMCVPIGRTGSRGLLGNV